MPTAVELLQRLRTGSTTSLWGLEMLSDAGKCGSAADEIGYLFSVPVPPSQSIPASALINPATSPVDNGLDTICSGCTKNSR